MRTPDENKINAWFLVFEFVPATDTDERDDINERFSYLGRT